jgi:hypothetical protein
MCALLPEPPGTKRLDYVGDQSKMYPTWDAVKAKHNVETLP